MLCCHQTYWYPILAVQFIYCLVMCECLHEHRKFKSPTDIFSRFQSVIALQENRVKYKLKPFNTIGHCQYFNNMFKRSLCRYLNSTRRHDINSEPSVQSSLNALRVLEVRKVWKWKMRSLEVDWAGSWPLLDLDNDNNTGMTFVWRQQIVGCWGDQPRKIFSSQSK